MMTSSSSTTNNNTKAGAFPIKAMDQSNVSTTSETTTITNVDELDRRGEFGVIGAEQEDETHYYDKRRQSLLSRSIAKHDHRASAGNDNAASDDENEDEDEEANDDERIQFSHDKLYGRTKELEKCQELYQAMLDSNTIRASSAAARNEGGGGGGGEEDTPPPSSSLSSCVVVAGYPGCGKSSLVYEFVKQLEAAESKRFLFLHAKYESLQQNSGGIPFSALTTLFDSVMQSQQQNQQHQDYQTEFFQNVHNTLQESLGDDVSILEKIFPGLKPLFGSTKTTNSTANEDNNSCSTSSSWRGGMITIPKNRLKFIILTLFRALASCRHQPLILFIDDLQWADESGLELLESLLTDETLPYLFVVGAFRSNEVNDNSGVGKLLKDVYDKRKTKLLQQQVPSSSVIGSSDEDQPEVVATNDSNGNKQLKQQHQRWRHIMMTTIELGDISLKAMEEFIADSLLLDPTQVVDLAQAIFHRTLGNPLFTMQALEQLVRKNALYFDNIIFSWSWGNLCQDEIEDLLGTDDIHDMVTSKIQHMPKLLQRILAVASYTRSTFDIDTVCDMLDCTHPDLIVVVSTGDDGAHPTQQHCLSSSASREEEQKEQPDENDESISGSIVMKRDILKLLDRAVLEGLLGPGPTEQEYMFTHDRIQEAATGFVTQEERETFLLNLGNGLLRRASSTEHGEDWMFFAAAQHLNSISISSSSLIDGDQTAKLRLAELNLRTATLSMSLLAFSKAVYYVNYGIDLLFSSSSAAAAVQSSDVIWEQHYQLALDLHSIGAHAETGLGNLEEAERHCNQVLERKKTLQDAIPAYKDYLDVLAGKSKKEEALNLGLDVLEQLGLKFPKTKRAQEIKAVYTLQRVKARYLPTEATIYDMSYVSDPLVADTMEILHKCGSFAYNLNMKLYILLCCESIRWMSKHGLTDTTASAVASLANVLTHKYDDFDSGVKLADLAIIITDRQKNKFNETRAINTANGMILSWVRPIRDRLNYHARAYESGMISGNTEGACVSKMFSFLGLFHSGTPLAVLERECRSAIPKMLSMGFSFYGNICSLPWQTALNLMGLDPENNPNTVLLTGSAMDEGTDAFHRKPLNIEFPTFKSYACAFFGDFESGAKDALERGDLYNNTWFGMQYGIEPFYRGICLSAMARKTGEAKYKKAAVQVVKQYKVWVKKGCVNLVGLLQLLEAEQSALAAKKKNKKQAYTGYEDAIGTLTSGGFHHCAALACERYSSLLLKMGEEAAARKQLLQAIDYYSRWGAKRKVDLIRGQLLTPSPATNQ